MVAPGTNGMGQTQLPRDYREDGHIPTYNPMGWSSSTLLNCTRVSSREGSIAALSS